MAKTVTQYEGKEAQDWTFADLRDWFREKAATQDRTNMQRLVMEKLDELCGDPPGGEGSDVPGDPGSSDPTSVPPAPAPEAGEVPPTQ